MKRLYVLLIAITLVFAATMNGYSEKYKSRYLTVFAHGMAGWDSVAGYHYFGLDSWLGVDGGTFVADACNWYDLIYCNDSIDANVMAVDTQVTAFQNSEQRGNELYNGIVNKWTNFGWKDYDWPNIADANYINIIAHSQGGLDMRKASKLLYLNQIVIPYEHRVSHWYGYTYETRYLTLPANTVKVGVAMSVFSPHRGSGIANKLIAMGKVADLVNYFASTWSLLLGGSNNDGYQTARQMMWKCYANPDPSKPEQIACASGYPIGSQDFNTTYPANTYAKKYVSFIGGTTASNYGSMVSYVLYNILNMVGFSVNGFVFPNEICNGNPSVADDDGFVPASSAQMGTRLQWTSPYTVTELTSLGVLSDLNNPTTAQQTSALGLINTDHLGVTFPFYNTGFQKGYFYAGCLKYMKDQGY